MTENPVRVATPHLYVYGRFDSPWAYLASRRVDKWTGDDFVIDWRVTSGPVATAAAALQRSREDSRDRRARLDAVRTVMEQVSATLEPDETLPFALAGFVPHTGAAAVAFAEAYDAGFAAEARRVLFDALWLHGCDLDDAHEVRTLLEDARSAVVWSEDAASAPRLRARRAVHTWNVESFRFAGRAGVVLVAGDQVSRDEEAVEALGSLLRRPAQSVLLDRSPT